MAPAALACPSGFNSYACNGGGANDICTVVTSTTRACDLTANGDSQGADVAAIYAPSVCDGGTDDYCVFGVDAVGNNFCCNWSDYDDVSLTITGGSYGDNIDLHYVISGTTYNLQNHSADYFDGVVKGQDGADTIGGSFANTAWYKDVLYGNDDDDLIAGNDGEDYIDGGAGYDTLQGGDHDDYIFGGLDDDVIQGGAGADNILGSYGDDEISGGADNDNLHGDNGDDTICGDSGQDQLWGGKDDDKLYGPDTNDVLSGDAPSTSPGDDCDPYSTSATGCEATSLTTRPAACPAP